MTIDLSHSPCTHLCFCTDGHPGQLLGIAGLLKTIFSKQCSSVDVGQVWIATPSAIHDFVQTHLNDFVPESRLQVVDVETKNEDRYFVQIGLSELFRKIEERDYVLCLDYDHLLISSVNTLFSKHPPVVVVSSEIRMGFFSRLEGFFGGRTEMQSLNTSLIWGRADRLQQIGDRWANCYSELASFLPTRNLTEYAFGLAAVRADTRIARCSHRVQGNMFNRNTDCIMFHYGGDDDESLLLKEELYRQGNACLKGLGFIKAVEKVDRFLRARIFAIESHMHYKTNGHMLLEPIAEQQLAADA